MYHIKSVIVQVTKRIFNFLNFQNFRSIECTIIRKNVYYFFRTKYTIIRDQPDKSCSDLTNEQSAITAVLFTFFMVVYCMATLP